MNKKQSFLFGTAGLSLVMALSVQADSHNLDTLVISAGLLPVESEKLGRAHTLITTEELETSQNRYVADALRSVPGLSVSRSGSFGGLTQIRVRGSEANHVLVLIDGVEVASTSGGEFDFGGLQLADIERIEVLRGPQSAFYGSNATSGVIQIITKGGLRNDSQFTAKTELGTDDTVLASLGVRGGGDNYDLALSGSFRRNDGFNISDFGSEDDGDENTTINSKLNWDMTEDVSLDLSLRYVDRESDSDDQDFAYPSTPTQGLVIDTNSSTATEEYYGAMGLNWSLFDGRIVQKTRAEFTDIERRGLNSGSDNGNDDRRYHLSHQGTYFFDSPQFHNAKHSLTAAIEAERESYTNAFPGSADQAKKQERDLIGYAAEYKGEFAEQLFISSAVRHDDNEDFKDAFTYSVSAAYVWPESGTRLHGSFGKGVTNPTFYEQFGYSPSRFVGNPDLKPEENRGWDLGIEQSFFNDQLTLDLTYFSERLKNEINTEYLPGFVSTPVNLQGVSERQGIELSVQIDVTKNLFVRGSYTYLDAKDPSGLEEVRRPMHSGALNLTYGFDTNRGEVFLDAIFNGEAQDLEFIYTTPESRVTLDNYVTVNLGAGYQLTDTLKVYGRIENLFDEEYEEVFGYNTQGAAGFVGLKATF